LLVRIAGGFSSSFSQAGPGSVSAFTALPVYTASSVSSCVVPVSMLPAVSTLSSPSAGAVHRYQTDFPPASPAWFGSPISFVAPTFDPATLPEGVARSCEAAKSSFVGAKGANDHCRLIEPSAACAAAPLKPSTAIR
jgi:hypothetical protein